MQNTLSFLKVGRALRASRSFLPPGTARLCGASSGHAGLRTRIIFLLFTLHCSLLAPIPAPASQPPFRGQYEITGIDGNLTNGYRLTGVFDDSSLLGYGAADATNGDLLFSSSSLGDLDIYAVTNIVTVNGVNLVIDVTYNEPGTPRSGGPEAGYAILARPITNGVVPRLSGASYQNYSTDLMNDAININLYYAYISALTNGSGPVDLSAWSSNNALQEITWLEYILIPDTNTLIATGTNLIYDATGSYIADGNRYTRDENVNIQWAMIADVWRWVLVTPFYLWSGSTNALEPHGTYSPYGDTTGTVEVTWGTIESTNTIDWRAGYSRTGRYWHISRDGVIVVNATNVATLADYLSTSNLLDSVTGRLAEAEITLDATTNALGVLATNVATLADYLSTSNLLDSVTGRLAEAENTLDITTNALSVLATNTATKAQGDLATSAVQIEADTNALAQLAIHADNTNNPHAVSAQQIGAITGATITGGSVTTNAGILDFVVSGDDYGIKEITNTEYAIAIEDNKWTLVQTSTSNATYTLPTIESAPFGYAITIVKGTNYPLQVTCTNAGGILFDGTNLINNSSAKMHLISLKCIASNTWTIESLTGTWETQ